MVDGYYYYCWSWFDCIGDGDGGMWRRRDGS